ncbi:MAG: hypothetical protein NT169_05885 [Chloroflexi bacterium]|nr:hypothetical protein [Chloroflexota bacterium]
MSPKHKTAALPRQAQAKAKPAATKPSAFLTVLVIASIVVVVLGIILLKDRPQEAVALSTVQGSSQWRRANRPWCSCTPRAASPAST